jgi:predicted permease
MDYRAQARSVRLGGYAYWNAILESRSGAERLQGLRFSGDGLSILGATPAVGRLFTAQDDGPGAPRVVMLGYGYWRRAFGGDSGIVGRTLPLNGESYTVVGVLPRFFPLPISDIDLVTPLDPQSDPRRNLRNSVNFLRVFARLEDSVPVATAERELQGLSARLRQQFPTEYAAKTGIKVTPLQEYMAATLKPTLVILLACVSLMVGVALVNVLNLLLARAVERQGETAVRLALGASNGRIALQVLTEGVLLALAAGVLGAVLAQATIAYAATHLQAIAPRIEEARLGLPVLALVVAVCGIAVLLFSLLSILIVRTTSAQGVLRGATRSAGGSPAQARARGVFIVAEMALALIIMSATAALLQSLIELQRVDLGYRPDSVFVARLSLPPREYRTPADISRFATAMSLALEQSPGVVAAGGSSIAPLTALLASVPFAPAQGASTERRDWPSATYRSISPGYLTAIGARLLEGRMISRLDDAAAPPVAVVNRALAERSFPNLSAVGRELLIDDNNTGPRPVTIVGVVDDLRELDLDGPIRPEVFISLGQVHPDGAAFVAATQFWAVRLRGDPAGFGPAFLQTLRQVDAGVATAGLTELRMFVDRALAPRRFSVGLLVSFTLIALLLTTLGVYGISAYMVEQRRREIGVRMALGATPQSIVTLMLSGTLRLTAIGVGVGLAGAWLTAGFMSRLMFGVSPGNPVLLLTVSAILLGTALVASWIPGRRAARIDALRALSAE